MSVRIEVLEPEVAEQRDTLWHVPRGRIYRDALSGVLAMSRP
jgi:hypothetical protein